jgi:nucleoid DNA-binding protein
MAVLEELVEVMKDQMQDSKRVKLDGFGSFKIGIESKGAQTAAITALTTTSCMGHGPFDI